MATDLRFPCSLPYLNPSTDFPSNQCTKHSAYTVWIYSWGVILSACDSLWNHYWYEMLLDRIVWGARWLLPKNNCVSHNHYEHKKINRLHNLAQCNICLLFGAPPWYFLLRNMLKATAPQNIFLTLNSFFNH